MSTNNVTVNSCNSNVIYTKQCQKKNQSKKRSQLNVNIIEGYIQLREIQTKEKGKIYLELSLVQKLCLLPFLNRKDIMFGFVAVFSYCQEPTAHTDNNKHVKRVTRGRGTIPAADELYKSLIHFQSHLFIMIQMLAWVGHGLPFRPACSCLQFSVEWIDQHDYKSTSFYNSWIAHSPPAFCCQNSIGLNFERALKSRAVNIHDMACFESHSHEGIQ